MNDVSWALAIDFGTTATAAAVRDGDGEVRGLALTHGGPAGLAMPSAVFADDDRTLLVGTMAENLAETNLAAFDATPKSRIAAKTMHLGSHEYTPAQVIGAVLAPVLAEAYRQHNGAPPASVTLTHPESWKKSRRQLLTEAYLSGIGIASVSDAPPPEFVSEPEAAAYWYARHGLPPAGQYFAIYDLGGGTFDTSVLQSTGTGFTVIASGFKDDVGGCNFDDALFDHIGRRYIEPRDTQLWQQLRSGAAGEISTQRHKLRTRVRMLKEQLTFENRVTLRGVPGYPEPVTISATDDYEPLIRDYVDVTVTELIDTLAEVNLTPQDLTAIYRIGGAARTPLVRAALDRLRCPIKDIDEPKLVVAQGAALYTTRTHKIAVPSQPSERDQPAADNRYTAAPEDLASNPIHLADPAHAESRAGSTAIPQVRSEASDTNDTARQGQTVPRRSRFRTSWLPFMIIVGIGIIVQQATRLPGANGTSPPSNAGNAILAVAIGAGIIFAILGYRKR